MLKSCLGDGPILFLHFYDRQRPLAELFASLISASSCLGGTPTGRASGHNRTGVRDQPFESIYDEYLKQLAFEVDGSSLFSDPNLRVCEVEIGAIAIPGNITELITVQPLPTSAYRSENHVVSILTNAGPFAGESQEAADAAGSTIAKTFHGLIRKVKPTFASIAIELPMETPFELLSAPNSYSFENFYVDEQFLGQALSSEIAGLAREAYCEKVAGGAYYACSSEFNPLRQSTPNRIAISCAVGELLGRVGKREASSIY